LFQNSPQYTYQLGDRPGTDFEEYVSQVALPEADPVHGESGPLMTLWKEPSAMSR
jgi:uncharacterized protein YjlB